MGKKEIGYEIHYPYMASAKFVYKMYVKLENFKNVKTFSKYLVRFRIFVWFLEMVIYEI